LAVAFVNQPKDFWKNELKDFSNKSGAEGSRSAESGPMLLDVLEGYLKYEVLLLTQSLRQTVYKCIWKSFCLWNFDLIKIPVLQQDFN
jgi:hypothetical protein